MTNVNKTTIDPVFGFIKIPRGLLLIILKRMRYFNKVIVIILMKYE